MSERPGRGAWARLIATAVVRDEGSTLAERARALVRDGAVETLDVAEGTISGNVDGCVASISAKAVQPRIWAAMTRFARGNRPLEEAVAGRAQSMHLEHLMLEDWSESLVPRPFELGRDCTCVGAELCEHVAALAYAFAEAIDDDPSALLRWRGCVAEPETVEDADTSVRPLDPTDDEIWRAGEFPAPRPLRPLPVGAVLKRLGPSGLELRGEELAIVLQRAYESFAGHATA